MNTPVSFCVSLSQTKILVISWDTYWLVAQHRCSGRPKSKTLGCKRTANIKSDRKRESATETISQNDDDFKAGESKATSVSSGDSTDSYVVPADGGCTWASDFLDLDRQYIRKYGCLTPNSAYQIPSTSLWNAEEKYERAGTGGRIFPRHSRSDWSSEGSVCGSSRHEGSKSQGSTSVTSTSSGWNSDSSLSIVASRSIDITTSRSRRSSKHSTRRGSSKVDRKPDSSSSSSTSKSTDIANSLSGRSNERSIRRGSSKSDRKFADPEVNEWLRNRPDSLKVPAMILSVETNYQRESLIVPAGMGTVPQMILWVTIRSWVRETRIFWGIALSIPFKLSNLKWIHVKGDMLMVDMFECETLL